MKKEKQQGLILQIYLLVLGAVICIGIITYVSQYHRQKNRVRSQTGIRAGEAAGEVINSLKEYPAYRWLLLYWTGHADEMDIEYDVPFTHETATEEKCALFSKRHPDMQIRYCEAEELDALPEEDQKLYAEIVYSWMITRMDAIKENYGCDYLFVVKTDTDGGPDPYGTQYYLLSAASPGSVRGTAYEEVYTLGVTASMAEKKVTREVMEQAVTKSLFSEEDDTVKRTAGESMKGAGNYLDYYVCMELTDENRTAFLVGATYNLKDMNMQIHIYVTKETLLSILYQFLLLNLIVGHILVYVLNPLKKVLGSIRSYSETKDSGTVEEKLHDILTSKRSFEIRRNEIGQLTRDFVALTKEIDDYIAQIERATAEKERIALELETAAQIQMHMLPAEIPRFPAHPEFDLCASMSAAKMVGGDFYDYFLIDDDHLALVMADVSDKGIPAALFMAEAKALIKSRLETGEEPAEVLAHVNNQLNETNNGKCFVTVWLAIIDLKTGEGIAANAGHEHPALCRKGESFELVVYKHSLVVGMLEDISFRQHTFKLNPGDRLFVYTDGVPEAANESLEQFGTGRMLEALNRNKEKDPRELLEAVGGEINAFIGQADRFDDTTMMCLRYNGMPESE